MSRLSRRGLLHSALAGGMSIGASGLAGAQRSDGSQAAGAPHASPPASSAKPTPSPATTAAPATPSQWRNWSGLHTCQPATWQVPGTVDELADLLRRAPGPIRCVGAGHSFTALVPTQGTLLSLDRLSGLRSHSFKDGRGQATLGAGTRLQVTSRLLDAQGLGLYNLPDIDAQTLAGAMATATHGTGVGFGALHTDLLGLSLMTPSGQLLQCSRDKLPEVFAAAQVSLGALGVLTEVTLQVRPRYHLQRRVWLAKTQDLLDQAPALAAKHRQFELYLLPFTGYGAAITHDEVPVGQVQRSTAADEDVLRDLRRLRDWLGRWPALRRWVAQRAIDPNQTEAMTDVSWKLLSTQRPTRFNETESHVPRENGVACLREVLATLERRNEVFFPIEFRCIRGDQAWLSPFYGRDSCSIAAHAMQGEPHDYLVSELGPVYRRHGARPHWGKLHDRSPAELIALYPQWQAFAAVRRELDPQGRMLTPYMKQLLGKLDMTQLKRRHFVAGAAALGLGAAVALRPSDRGGAHDAYFQTLQRALQASGPALPTLVVDRQRLLANLGSIAKTTQPGLALRVVVKSLPSLNLIEHALKTWRTEKVMTFNAPQLLALARARPSVQVLLGKPLPVSTAQWVLAQLAGAPFNAPRQIEWLIDTPARAAQYRELARATGVPLRLNVELDVGLHRGGIESDADLAALIKIIQGEPLLSWSGFMGYDPHIVAIPDLPGAREQAANHARAAYARHFANAQSLLGNKARETLTLNTAGSLTYHLHDGKQVPNEVSVGSAAVKPLDFERPSTQALMAASFIATPVLKTMETFRLPVGVEWISRASAAWDPNQARALAIHGGHWLADPVSPPGVAPSGLYGASSNQQVLVASSATALQPDDWVFLRPRQSEAVLLQFGDIAVFDGQRISERWPVFAASA